MSSNNLAAIAALCGASAATLAASTTARAKQKKTHSQNREEGSYTEDRMNLEFEDEAYIAERMGELTEKDITEIEAEYKEAEHNSYLLRLERNGLINLKQFLEQNKGMKSEPTVSASKNVVSAQNNHIYEDPDVLYKRSQRLLIRPMDDLTIHIMKVTLREAHRLDVVNATPKWKNMLESEIVKDMFAALSSEIDRNAGKAMNKKKDWIAFLEEVNDNTITPNSDEKQGKYIKKLWNIYGSMVKQGQTDYLDKMLNIYNQTDDVVWKKSCLIDIYRLRKSSSRSQNVIIARKITAACKKFGIEDKHIRALGKVDTLLTRPTDSVKNYLLQKERE